MAVTARRAVASAWPILLLALFLGTFRRSAEHTSDDAASAVCDAGGLPRDAASLERCVALDPGDVGALNALGAAYETAGREDRAEDAYRRALAIDPRDGDVHVRLGRLLLARGDRAAAKTEGEAALHWQPGARAATALVAAAAAGMSR